MEDLSLGRRLQIARAEAGLSITNAAQKVGIARETLSAYEHDHGEPSASVLRKLVELYETDAHFLLFGTTPSKRGGKARRPSTYVQPPLVRAVG